MVLGERQHFFFFVVVGDERQGYGQYSVFFGGVYTVFYHTGSV